MNILGIYIGGHDSNIAISIDGKVQYFKFERITGIKHAKIGLKEACEWVCNNHNFKPDIIVYSDGERNGLGKCTSERELYKKLPDNIFYTTIKNKLKEYCNRDTDKIYILDHHFTHVSTTGQLLNT
jgi:carbamoyltransferase